MKNEIDAGRTTRPIYDIPDDIDSALLKNALYERYRARPPYQQNDYIGWITRAKRGETRAKRLGIMLDELRAGNGYMGMEWNKK